jgi:hypothetical protein
LLAWHFTADVLYFSFCGGGVDFGRRTALRLSVDYAPIFGSNNTGANGQGSGTANNVIFGIGVRFK